MKVTHLTSIVDHKTVCETYVTNLGTNRIEINVLKGKMPTQLEVSPKLLEFEAEGGEQAITVKKGYFQLSNCFWEENQQWGWRTQFDNDTTIIVKVPENTTTEERTTKLIVWAANKSFDQIDMEKDVFDTAVVVIKQKGKKEFRVPEYKSVRIKYLFQLKDDTSTKETHFKKGENTEIKTERSGNGLRVTAKYEASEQTGWEAAEISFVINGYNGEEITQDCYVSDLVYKQKVDYRGGGWWIWTREIVADRIEYGKWSDGWITFLFYSGGSNLNVTSYNEKSDDYSDDSHWGYSTSDIVSNPRNYIAVTVDEYF